MVLRWGHQTARKNEDIESVEMQPVYVCSAAMKVLTEKSLVEMGEYLSENPQIVVNGFSDAGISAALELDDSYESDQEEGEVDDLSDEAKFDPDDETVIISSDDDSD